MGRSASQLVNERARVPHHARVRVMEPNHPLKPFEFVTDPDKGAIHICRRHAEDILCLDCEPSGGPYK